MDAYTSYILKLNEARLRDLRREAAEYGLSRAARKSRGSAWTRIRARAGRRPRSSVVPMPRRAPAVEGERPLRRSA